MSFSPFIQTQKSYNKNCEYCNKLLGFYEHHNCNFKENDICKLCGINYKRHSIVNHMFYIIPE
jgi:rRNA maturation endonuclease Nob1